MAQLTADIRKNPQRWDLPARQAIMARVQRVALETESERTLLAAARLIAQLEAQNQADEHKQEPDKLLVASAPMTTDAQAAALRRMLQAERDKRGTQ